MLHVETAPRAWISWPIPRAGIQGHGAVPACVFGSVDHAHPAAAQPVDDAVVRDGLADH